MMILAMLACLCAVDDPNQRDRQLMQGDWAVETMVRDGEELEAESAQVIFRTIQGDEFTMFLFKRPLSKGTQKIDATKSPKTIDLQTAPLNGRPGQLILGIYEINGDTWKVCVASPGKERPKEFSSKKDSQQTLTVYRREKK